MVTNEIILFPIGIVVTIIVLWFVHLTLQPPNYSIWIFTHLKLCLAHAIHNFRWVKIIQIWQNEGQLFPNLADLMLHFIINMCLKRGTFGTGA